MIIGVDLDGVIMDTEQEYMIEAELYDIKLGKNHLKNKNEYIQDDRYSWTDKESKDFEKNWIKCVKKANYMPGAISIIKMLKKEGNKFILITSRTEDAGMDITEESLRKNDIEIDKCYWNVKDKVTICRKENVDVMIEDYWKNVLKLTNNKIMTLYFRDVNMKRLDENKYLREINNWGEIYKYIYVKTKSKR